MPQTKPRPNVAIKTETRSALAGHFTEWQRNSIFNWVWFIKMYRVVRLSDMPRHGCNRNKSCLLFNNSVVHRSHALQNCETEEIVLSMTKKTENLGYGVWLIMFVTTSYTLNESDMDSTLSSRICKYPGCRMGIITPKCQIETSGEHIKDRSDLSNCDAVPSIIININFPDPLKVR